MAAVRKDRDPADQSILKRTRNTAPQKSLDPAGRLKNLEQAFTAGHIPPNIRSVILVDDIYTTGSTIEACTRVLKKPVWNMCILSQYSSGMGSDCPNHWISLQKP